MELVILDLATLGAVSSIAVLCALAVVVLPWTDAELRQTLSAARAIPAMLAPALGSVAPALVSVAPALRSVGAAFVLPAAISAGGVSAGSVSSAPE